MGRHQTTAFTSAELAHLIGIYMPPMPYGETLLRGERVNRFIAGTLSILSTFLQCEVEELLYIQNIPARLTLLEGVRLAGTNQ